MSEYDVHIYVDICALPIPTVHGLASLTLGSGDAQIWHSCGMLDAPDRGEANTRRTVS